jgi:hypothetical protein
MLLVNSLAGQFSSNSSTLSAQMWLHRYGQKLRTIYANGAQSFLLLIDQVLASNKVCSQLSPIENKQYTYLKKLVGKKLKVPVSQSGGGKMSPPK